MGSLNGILFGLREKLDTLGERKEYRTEYLSCDLSLYSNHVLVSCKFLDPKWAT